MQGRAAVRKPRLYGASVLASRQLPSGPGFDSDLDWIWTWNGLDLDLDLHGGGAHNSGSSAFDFTLAWCHLEVIYVRTWAAHQELTHSIYRARSTSQTQQMTPTWDLEFGVADPNDRIRRPAQASFVRGRCFGD